MSLFRRRRLHFFLAGAVLAALAPLAESFDTQQFLERAVISDVSLAPNGSRVLYRVTRADVTHNTRLSSTWVLSIGDRKTVQIPIDEGQAFGWRRDGSGFLFATSDGGIHEWDMASSSDRLLMPASRLRALFPTAQSVDVQEIDVAPKGTLVAIAATITERVDEHPLKGVEVDADWSLPPNTSVPSVLKAPTTTTLLKLDLAAREISKLLPDEFEAILGFHGHGIDWSPNGKSLTFAASKLQPQGAFWNYMSSDLYLLDLTSNKIQLLVKEPGLDLQPFWSPDGKRIAFSTMAGKFDWADWEYTFQIGFVDLTAKEPHAWFPFADTPEDPRTRWLSLGGWSRTGKEFYFVAPVRGHSEPLAMNITTRALRSLPHADGANSDVDRWITDWRTARNSDVVVFQSGDFNRAPELYALRPLDKKPQHLTNLNPVINNHPYARVESVAWPSKDGKWELQGFLLTPIHAATDAKLPLIAEVVGGPGLVTAGVIWTAEFTYLPEPTFVEHGYAVFLPNTRGRYGFGEAFNHSLYVDHSMNRVPAIDLISGVNHLVEKGRIDPDRVGIAGYSYGGGVTAYALALSQSFRGAVIDEGVFLNPWDHFDSSPNRIRWAHLYGASSPFDPNIWSLLLKDSPTEVVSSIKTPILLGFGIDSEAEPQGRPFFAALQKYRVPSEFVVYPRSGHSTMEPVLVMDGYQRKLEWFDYWVKGIASERMLRRYGSSRKGQIGESD
jgi:dipeptidyl aminopeptidase/acylaminoacyl peptidase